MWLQAAGRRDAESEGGREGGKAGGLQYGLVPAMGSWAAVLPALQGRCQPVSGLIL